MKTENVIAILNLYHDEWKYRHENFWKRLIQFSVIIFFTSTLPITFRIFDNLVLPKISLLVFPICGFCFTFIFFFYCLAETSRMIANDENYTEILKEIFDGNFRKKPISDINAPPVLKFFIHRFPILRLRIGVWIPIVLSIIQVFISITVFVLILQNRL